MMRPGSIGKDSARWRRVSRGFVLVLLGGACGAQRYTPPPPPLTLDPCAVASNPKAAAAAAAGGKAVVCPPAAAAKESTSQGRDAGHPGSTADQFPFPGDAQAPVAAAKESTSQGRDAGHPAAADQFPFPGETSKSPDAVPEGNTPRYVPDAPVPGAPAPGSSGGESSSSSSSGGAAGGAADNSAGKAAGDDDAPAAPKGRRRLPKVSAVSPDERVTNDLDVAKFYTDRGNFQAAYLRAKDATKTEPDDPPSHFALAQAAERLHKKEEAAAEYALYLQLDPVGEKRAMAQKALAALR